MLCSSHAEYDEPPKTPRQAWASGTRGEPEVPFGTYEDTGRQSEE